MPTTPPLAATASSCASVRLRVDGQSACAFECVATSGAVERRATSQKPRSLRCERSTSSPSRLQRRTSRSPAAVRPGPVSGEPGKRNGTPSAKAFGRLQTSPIERRPALDERLEGVQLLVDRLRPLEVEDRGEPAALDGGLDVRELSRDPHRAARRRPRARAAARQLVGLARRRLLLDLRRQLERVVARRRRPLHIALQTGSRTNTAKKPPAKPPARARGRSRWPRSEPSRKPCDPFVREPQDDVVVAVEDRDRRQRGSDGSSEYMTKSLLPADPRVEARRAQRPLLDVAGALGHAPRGQVLAVGPQLHARDADVLEQPVRDQPQRARRVAVAARVGPHPVADLGHALLGLEMPRSHRADDAAARDLDDREVRVGAVAPALLAVLDVPARVVLGVRLRDQVEPARDLGLGAGLRDRGDVRGLPRAQRDDAVRERRVRRLRHPLNLPRGVPTSTIATRTRGETQERPRTRMATPARGRRDQRRRSHSDHRTSRSHGSGRPRAPSGGARHAQPLDVDALHGRDPRRRGRARRGRAARRRHRPLHRPLAQGQVRRRRARLARPDLLGRDQPADRRGALPRPPQQGRELPRGPGSLRGRRLRGRRPGAPDRRPRDHEPRLPRAVRARRCSSSRPTRSSRDFEPRGGRAARARGRGRPRRGRRRAPARSSSCTRRGWRS